MIESVRTPEPRVQGQGICPVCDFASRPATKDNLRLWNDSRNEFLTRSNVKQQRVSHSFRRASRSFQLVPLVPTIPLVPDTQSNESHTRVDELRARSRFATHGRDQHRTGNHRAQRAPQQGAEEKNSTALRYHVCSVSALCPARNFRTRSNQTMGCAHAWMSGRAYESSLSMSRLVYRLKTSAVLWQCGWSGTNTPPDEDGQNYLHPAS